jgi:prepilin-type N-terminal cleavage/methylation domain-containing protein
MKRSTSPSGFTLIELVVGVAVLAIQAAVVVPGFVDLTRETNEAAARSALSAVRATETSYFFLVTPGRYATVRQMFDEGHLGAKDAASLGVATSVPAAAGLDNAAGGRSTGYHFVLEVSP